MIVKPCKKKTIGPIVISFQDWGDAVNSIIRLVDSQSSEIPKSFAKNKHRHRRSFTNHTNLVPTFMIFITVMLIN